MKNFIVTFTEDGGRTECRETVAAVDYTAAYLITIIKKAIDIIILSIKEI